LIYPIDILQFNINLPHLQIQNPTNLLLSTNLLLLFQTSLPTNFLTFKLQTSPFLLETYLKPLQNLSQTQTLFKTTLRPIQNNMLLLDIINVPTLGFLINNNHYGHAVCPDNEEHYTNKIINGYIVQMIRNYTTNYYKGEDLWSAFWDDFDGFTQQLFTLADKQALQHLCGFLVPMKYGSIFQWEVSIPMPRFFLIAYKNQCLLPWMTRSLI
jgi:hypothetical protein